MESLSRPLHRRGHSAANAFSSSFSLKNPYDDVVLFKGGKRKSLEPHEYTEIFSGSSSIPVLDIPGLDERVGSADCRSSVLDYSNIFGGLRNDDVAMPYEELFSGSAKKTKAWIPADFQLPLQRSGSVHSSGNAGRASGEASKQAVDEAKQQFNMSFNRTNQRNSHASNGKTHKAQHHTIPGFTSFVDGTPQLQKTDHKRVPSLDCEVSHTWSFSAEVEDVKAKNGLRSERSHIPDLSPGTDEVNLKSGCSKVPPSSSCPLNLSDNKDPRQPRPSNLASGTDASGKIAGDCSPPLLDEEFDENSAAAALKKAIKQAQESIRIAKMIMEREKEGREDSSKARSSGHLKALDKESNIDHAACGSKLSNSKEGYQELDRISTGIVGNIRSLGQNDTLINGGNSKVERATKKLAATKEHGEAFARGDKLFSSSCSQSKRIYLGEKVEPEKHGENVKTAEIHGEATGFPGLVTYGECRTANLGAGKVGNDDSIMFSMNELASNTGMIQTGKEALEQRDAAVCHTEGPEVLDGTSKRDLSESQKMQELAKGVGKAEQSWATFSHEEGPEDIVELGERVLYTSLRAQVQEKVVDDTVENWRTNLEKQVTEERENDMDQGMRDRKFEECEEMHNVEYLTTMESKFDYFLNESFKLNRNQVLEQEEMEKKSKNMSEWNKNGHSDRTYDGEENDMRQKEDQQSFESKVLLKEALLEDIYEGEPNAFPEMGKFEEKFEAHESEIDCKKQSHAYDGAEPKFPGNLEQNKIEERHENTSEHETAESRVTEANDAADVQENEAFWDAEETNKTLIGTGGSEEDHGICEFQEDAYEEDMDKTGTANASGANVIFGQTQETFKADLNNTTEEYQEAVNSNKENDTVPEVTGTMSEIDGDVEAEQLFHLNRNEIPGIDSLRRSASEETSVESKLLNAFEGSSPDGKTEHVGVTDTDPREKGISSDGKTESVGVNNTDARDKGISSDGKTENVAARDTDPRDKGISSDGKTVSVGVTEADPIEKGHSCDDKSENVRVTNTGPGGEGLSSDGKSKNVGVMDADSKEKFLEDGHIFETDSEIHDAAQDLAAKIDRKNLPNVLSSDNKKDELDLTGVRLESEQSSESDGRSASTCSLEDMDRLSAHESEGCAENAKDKISNKEEMVDDLEVSNERKCVEEQGDPQLHGEPKEMGKSMETGKTVETSLDIEINVGDHVGTSMGEKDTKEHVHNFDKHERQQKECAEEQSEGMCSQLHGKPKKMGESMETGKTVETNLDTEENKNDLVGTSTTSVKDAKEHVQNFDRCEQQQRIEAIKKGREREKDRIAVERAIREARERAFAEARERAERERANAEVQQRVTAEAQEKLEKASAVKQPADKASTKAKLRAERAAVERALAEARERALEKALSLKTSAELRTKADRYPTESSSSSSRNNGLKHSFSSSDLENATNAESAERRKARLERQQRIMERAAKALAEKNKRDLLALKEQAERNRLAEFLDADIKRWATGKEGNLRALLSTLQYILGQDSGWQPISLTEIITSAAVKKAYRKATLYVHPDKLQQRGATIQQKYICEKVFDLLKAAWNKFNSEET